MNTTLFPVLASLTGHDPLSWFADPNVPVAQLAYCLTHGLVRPVAPTGTQERTPLDALLERLESSPSERSSGNDWPTTLSQPWPTLTHWSLEAVLALLVAHTDDPQDVLKAMRAGALKGWSTIVTQCLRHRAAPTATMLNACDAPPAEGMRRPQPWLHLVARCCNDQALQDFLQHPHVDANVCDANGRTALFVVGTPEKAQLLIEGGCDPRVVDTQGTDASAAWADRIRQPAALEAMFQVLHNNGGARGTRAEILLTLTPAGVCQLDEAAVAAMVKERVRRATPKGPVDLGVVALFALNSIEVQNSNKYHSENERIDAVVARLPDEAFCHESIPGIADGELLWVAARCNEHKQSSAQRARIRGKTRLHPVCSPERTAELLIAVAERTGARSVLGAMAADLIKPLWTTPTLLPVALTVLAAPQLSAKTAMVLAGELPTVWTVPHTVAPGARERHPTAQAEKAFDTAMASVPSDAGRFAALFMRAYAKERVAAAERRPQDGLTKTAVRELVERWRNEHPEWAGAFAETFRLSSATWAKLRTKAPKLSALLTAWTLDGAVLPVCSTPTTPRPRL